MSRHFDDLLLGSIELFCLAAELSSFTAAATSAGPHVVVRKLEDAGLVVVAAPSHLQRAGIPASLEALQQHDCIQFLLPSSGQKISWLFSQDGQALDVATSGGYCCSEDLLGGVTLARHGAGLLQTYRFIVEEDLQRGSLHEVLQSFAGRSRPFSLLYPDGRHLPLPVRLFIDFLVEKLSH